MHDDPIPAQRLSRQEFSRTHPPALSVHRGGRRRQHDRDALCEPRRRPSASHPWRAVRRRRRRWRRDLGARRPGVANAGRGLNHRIVQGCPQLPPTAALPESDFTVKMLVEELPGGQDIFYRVRFRDLSHTDIEGEPMVGRFRTAPSDKRDVSFVWGGDVAGQGWGINPDDGGMFTFSAMRKHRPDFLLHSGDTIYADGVIPSEVKLADAKI